MVWGHGARLKVLNVDECILLATPPCTSMEMAETGGAVGRSGHVSGLEGRFEYLPAVPTLNITVQAPSHGSPVAPSCAGDLGGAECHAVSRASVPLRTFFSFRC